MHWANPERRRGKYLNPHRKDLKRNLWNVILWFCGCYNEPDRVKKPPEDFMFPLELEPVQEGDPSLVWVGHSTFLIQVGGVHFLTDPVFGSYCSPVPIGALKRIEPAAITIENLPTIDCVLVSHNHYDHLEEESVYLLNQRFPDLTWVVAEGLKYWFHKRGIKNVVELGWGEDVEVKEVRLTAVPAQHFSGRGIFDKNRTLWCGFIGEYRKKTFYFVGDTGYNPVQFKEIGERWPSIDLSMIPIGTYVPKRFMGPVHISPAEAVQIHRDVGSQLSIGMHWNTFILSEEDPKMPPYDLFLAMQKQQVPLKTFLPITQGIKINW